ncbi:MAG TPA: GtrA family protein [Pseudonocardiaceae bacterium]
MITLFPTHEGSGAGHGGEGNLHGLDNRGEEPGLVAPEVLRLRLTTQLTRFVLVGGVAALVDYSSYQALLAVGLWVHLAKALGFILGTTTAYLINRRWTFQGRGGGGQFASVMLLYGITFVVQVGMNAVMLALLPPMRGEITLAFVVAQGTATCINFVVQRTVIFRL